MGSLIRTRLLMGIGAAASVVAATVVLPASASTAPIHTYPSALSPADLARLSASPIQKVIVILRNQHPEVPGAPGRVAARAATLKGDQAHITNELATLRAPNVHSYSFVNAVSATVSAAEKDRLAADPAVLAVVPDTLVAAPTKAASDAATAVATQAASGSGTAADVCPTNPAQPLLEPEALQVMNVENGPGVNKPAAHDLATGKGVKIAVFPDGLDPNIPDFKRADGTSAIFDYQDFSGTGLFAPGGGGGEAFGDASSLIAQGTHTYNLNGEVNAAFPLPKGCNIRIRGVAPDASVAVMKVFGGNIAFNSTILQGIDYAITVDNVDILSQSFGGNPQPNPGTDPIALLDANAVAAGITVVVSSGDAGTTNTIGTPATNPAVISVGATTTYRLYAQTSSYLYQRGGKQGWVSNNVSAISSSGHTDFGPHTIDVLAPGESGWSDCSTNTVIFANCADIYHGPTAQPIIAFGGTSESCPLTAGTAALVIQAYRDTHGGATPSPALVKQIIMSTAQDIDVTSSNQGAGLVDALRAVQQARSIKTPAGSPAATGQSLLYSPSSISLVAQPGHTTFVPVTVTNTGSGTQLVTPAVRTLGAPSTIAQGDLTLNPATDPTDTYMTGTTVHDVHTVHFSVPVGTDRLVSRVAWDSSNGNTLRVTLFDPLGRIESQSRPQGSSGFGEQEIHDAQFGTWTMVVFDATGSPYSGRVHFTITGARFNASNVTGQRTLNPGQSTTFSVPLTTPSSPGDADAAVTFTTALGTTSQPAPASIPVSLRALVSVDKHHGGSFSGTLTGPNGRMGLGGQVFAYQFDVPNGVSAIGVDVTVGGPGYQLLGILTDPSISPVDAQSTITQDGSANLSTMHLTWANPVAGRWSLNLATLAGNSSLLTSAPFSGVIRFGKASVSASGVPDTQHTTLTKGKPVTATLHITNNGNSPEFYSVDPRLDQATDLSLFSLTGTSGTLPLDVMSLGTIPQFVVPPFSTNLEVAAASTVPINFTTSPNFGTPEIGSVTHGTNALITYTAPDIAASVWSCPPTEIGPGPSVSAPFACGAVATTKTFDPAVGSSTGNVWSWLEGLTGTPHPLELQPGQSGDITVTITPGGSVGQVVSGFLAVESFSFVTFSSDQFASIPYIYRVG
jgi:hypothetical protein